MDSIFKISKSGTYGILVEGLEKDNGEYLDELTGVLVSTRQYAYSHSVTLNVLTYLAADGTETDVTFGINDHSTIDSQLFNLTKDGLYRVSHIILPNQTWLAYVLEREPSAITLNYSHAYYYNTNDSNFYIYANGTSTKVLLAEILKAPTVNKVLSTDLVTTLIKLDKNTFIMYYLNDCFGAICKELLQSLPQNCKSNSDEYKQKIYNRDIIWMGINVIKYALSISQYYEAQRYLELLTRCGLICSNLTNNRSYDCQCS